MGRLHRRYRKRRQSESAPRRNPPMIMELLEFIGPGFAAFGLTRLGTRIAAQSIAKRKPSWGKHAGALASVGAFLSAWLLANRVKMLERYHTPIAVGAGIAALQSLVQLYIPKLGWMVADASPELEAAATQQAVAAAAPPQLPDDLEYVDEDPDLYSSYADPDAAGRYATGAPQAAHVPDDADLDEAMQGLGAFGAH